MTLTPLSEILSEIGKLNMEGRTGLYLVTMGAQAAQINLENGEIVSLSYRGKYGEEALTLLRDLSVGCCNFLEGSKAVRRQTLPPTRDILDFLGAGLKKPAAATAAAPSRDWDRALLEEELTEFLGPIASFICEEKLGGVADLESALAVLSQELVGSEQISQFQANVRSRL